MDWSELAPTVGAVAPTLGRLLGGAIPLPFGSAIGGAIGGAIASALGVDANPQSVNSALGATPSDVKIAQLRELEADAKAKYAALATSVQAEAQVGTAEVQSTAATMQSELVSGTWYQRWWRPAAMYLWVATWPFQLYLIARAGDMAGAVNAFALWNAGPAALAGVYSYGRSWEKVAALKNGN